jgi:dienelactone hydrolase
MIVTTGGLHAGPGLARTKRFTRVAIALCAALLPALVTTSLPSEAASPDTASVYGPFGPEGPRLREQLWILPSADHAYPLRATVFRPADAPDANGEQTRHPLVVINHGTSDATRMAVAMPVYYWLSRWFVDRGYVVVLPQRRGHGATGGPMAESIGSCADPDHFHSGLAAADDIEGAADYMSAQPFVAPGEAIVVGISSGGWASLALASRNPGNVRAVINIAGGRGGRPYGQRMDTVCGEKRLIEATRSFADTARVPTLWLYADNDSYFRPDLARAMASAWQAGGGEAELHVFPAYGEDGHNLADDRAGWDIWGSTVDKFLDESRKTTPVAALEQASPQAEPASTEAQAEPAPTEAQPEPAAAAAAPSGPLATVASDGETRAP